MSDAQAARARALAGGPERHHDKAREQGKQQRVVTYVKAQRLESTQMSLSRPRLSCRANLTARLVTRPRATVESVERRGLQKKRTHHVFGSTTGTRVPSARTL